MQTTSLRRDILHLTILLVLAPTLFLNASLLIRSRMFIRTKVENLAENSLAYASDNLVNIAATIRFTGNQIVAHIVTGGILDHLDDRSREGIRQIRATSQFAYLISQQSPFLKGITIKFGSRYQISSTLYTFQSTTEAMTPRESIACSDTETLSLTALGDLVYTRKMVGAGFVDGQPVEIELTVGRRTIQDIVASSAFSKDVASFILDGNGRVVASGGTALPPSLPEKLRARAEKAAFSFTLPHALAFGSKAGDLGLYLLAVVPNSLIDSELLAIFMSMFSLALLLVAISVGVAFTVSARITKPLYLVMNSFDRVGSGDFTHRIELPDKIVNKDAAKLVADFNLMINKINTLVEDVKDKEKEASVAQLMALQAQINPHFLYNTLDMIRGLAGARMTAEIRDVAGNLAELFRYSIVRGDALSRLGEEIRVLNKYIDIQRVRFAGRFVVHFRIGANTEDCAVPRLVLQPVVENAYRHGLEPKEGHGSISITSRIVDTDAGSLLAVSVADTGIGMDPENLRRINALMKDGKLRLDGDEYGGMGLVNVNRRIQMRYGAAYGIEIESEPNRGTTVHFRLPESRCV